MGALPYKWMGGAGGIGGRGPCHITTMHNILVITGEFSAWQGGSIIPEIKEETVPPRVAEAATVKSWILDM